MMFPLFETIAITNSKIQNLALHQQRYINSLKQFYGKNTLNIHDFSEIIQIQTALIQTQHAPLIRCRIDYNATELQVQYFAYQRKTYRTFQPVICDEIDYGLKYADRTYLNQLLQQKGDCDEIMIIKQGKVTDCTIGNLIFRQGEVWVTPDTPLFAGTQRAKLLAANKIQQRTILLEDIATFDEVRLINALNPL
ncbi:aminotransferase class IV family protein [Pasteurella oralis]|uniref:aminotransferase class IV family protein n=1 Tax=Pasteurella oralis TaxID=1071947 RepID=UPI000C7CF6E0|nr:aminotransferase class IV family protein [Pasteurella oralis]